MYFRIKNIKLLKKMTHTTIYSAKNNQGRKLKLGKRTVEHEASKTYL